MATLAAAIVGVIVVNGAFSFWQEYRAEETMAALQRLLPHQVRAHRDGAVVVIPSEAVVPGDVILLTPATTCRQTAASSKHSAYASTTRP